MRKILIAMFVFVSCFTTKAFSDGHSIKMGIILGFTGPKSSFSAAGRLWLSHSIIVGGK